MPRLSKRRGSVLCGAAEYYYPPRGGEAHCPLGYKQTHPIALAILEEAKRCQLNLPEIGEAYQGLEENRQALQKFVADAYFALARNVLRYQWLITYLFGNSPALCKSFVNGRESALQSLDAKSYYNPYATSLRMSDIGYTNRDNPSLNVSYNNLDGYIRGLTHATNTPYQPYVDKGVIINGEPWQLNANILQIENEYYSAVRPKQPTRSGERPTTALKKRGVQYVEIRVLDVDTFSPIGLNEMQLRLDVRVCPLLFVTREPATDGARKS